MTQMDSEAIKALSRKILAAAKRAGATEAAVSLDGSRMSLARFSRNQIIQNVEQSKLSATLAVAVGRREAAVTTDLLSEDEIDVMARNAVELAGMYPENQEFVSCVQPCEYPEILNYDSRTADFSHQDKADAIREVCSKVGAKKLLAYGTFTTGTNYTAVANTNGLFAYHPETDAKFTLTVRTANHGGSCREDRSHFRIDGIDFSSLTDTTMEWARRSEGPSQVEPGDYTVVLTPTAALNYLMMFFWTLDARMVDGGRSALTSHFETTDVVSAPLISPLISINSRLNYPGSPEKPFGQTISMEGFAGQGLAAMTFSKGLPIKEFPIVENGQIKNLFYSLYWAKKCGIEPFAFPNLLEFKGSQSSLDDLIKGTQRGLLVNSFWYIRFVDPNHLLLTGLTRDGVFMIEDGKVTKPVKNLRFNESPLVSLCNVDALGIPERRKAYYSTALIPSMRINNFSFSSVTEAI